MRAFSTPDTPQSGMANIPVAEHARTATLQTQDGYSLNWDLDRALDQLKSFVNHDSMSRKVLTACNALALHDDILYE